MAEPAPPPERGTGSHPASRLDLTEKARRAGSFGGVAAHYERYRPGPPIEAVDWLLPERVERVVDLGAGTGALTRLLVGRAQHVVAVEPDARMRAVLSDEVAGVQAVAGRGEEIPLPDACADAVLASSSWHWMDPLQTLREVGRVLRPGGTLGTLWSGPDDSDPFVTQVRAAALAHRSDPSEERAAQEFARMTSDTQAPAQMERFSVPPGVGFSPPEKAVFRWTMPLDGDELIGLLGTFSAVITMTEERRRDVLATARRLLGEVLGADASTPVDVAFRCQVWRTRHLGG